MIDNVMNDREIQRTWEIEMNLAAAENASFFIQDGCLNNSDDSPSPPRVPTLNINDH